MKTFVKSSFLITVFVFIYNFSFSQGYYHLFGDRSFGGNSLEHIDNMVYDGNGHFIIAGRSRTNINGDKTEGQCWNSPFSDLWVIKIDTNLNLIWNKSIGGSYDEFYPQLLLAGNEYLISGSSGSDSSCEKSQPRRGNPYYTDYWLYAMDTSGNKLWDKTYGGNSSEDYPHIIQLSSGNLALIGVSSSDSSGDKTVNNYSAQNDFWVVTMDQNGNKLSDKVYGGSGDDGSFAYSGVNENGFSVIPTDSNSYIIAGSTRSPISNDVSSQPFGLSDIWIIKIDSSGNKVWDKRYGGSTQDACAQIIQTSTGYMLVGLTDSPSQSGNLFSSPVGNMDVLVMKLDKQGNRIWDKRYGAVGGGCWGASIAAAANGEFWIGATTTAQLITPSYGGSDYWVFKIDSMGNQLWDHRFGGSPGSSSTLMNLILMPDSSIYLCGYSDSGTSAVKTSPGNGGSDYWVLHFSYTATNPTGLIETNDNNFFTVFPNPADDYILVNSFSLESTELKIYNSMGQFITSKNIQSEVRDLKIDISNYPKGMYFWKAETKNHTIQQGKLVICSKK